jgi:hypothetical protein
MHAFAPAVLFERQSRNRCGEFVIVQRLLYIKVTRDRTGVGVFHTGTNRNGACVATDVVLTVVMRSAGNWPLRGERACDAYSATR